MRLAKSLFGVVVAVLFANTAFADPTLQQFYDAHGVVRTVSPSNPLPTGTKGTTFAPAQVTLSAVSATLVLSAGAYSVRLVCNYDASISEYAGGVSVTGVANGVLITAGTCWDFSRTTAAIYAIAASATPKANGVQY